ncbi:hypothetical protein SAMN05421505_1676 [Sinosporangium album]|uniref:DUF4440 domain-containing protein n=1 Tax=Sinosporangium album TaxID=504805 RepID=A0A1G8LGZ1_9ACTN|nr:hypothetical protein [Sinosporangium album]SDI54490.1 hypothetical protein SAMN05421505_1676 [Sinosporangium album]
MKGGTPHGASADHTRREVEAEVVRHHQVIERWLSGSAGKEEFDRFAEAHAVEFTLTTADGATLDRARVLKEVEGLHGSAPGLRIAIQQVRLVASEGPLLAVAYQEWQPAATRQSTVLLRRRGTALLWLHLHETWLRPSP